MRVGGLRSRFVGKIGALLRSLKRKHPAAYDIIVQKSKELGVSAADLVAALASKLLAEEADADVLEAAEFIAQKSAEMKAEFVSRKQRNDVVGGLEMFTELVNSVSKLAGAVAQLANSVADSSIAMLEATQRVHRKVKEVMLEAFNEERKVEEKKEKEMLLDFIMKLAEKAERMEKAKAFEELVSKEEVEKELKRLKELEKEVTQ